MTANLDANLNSFASRSFRYEADHDYIAARMAYRAGLLSQALWSSLQAIEKYFKYILLVNRVPKPEKNLGHNIAAGLDLIHASTRLRINFVDPNCARYFKKLAEFGEYRYAEVSQYSMPGDLHLLDSAVWSIRRFCKPLDMSLPDGRPALALELQAIVNAEARPHHKFILIGGELERIQRGNDAYLKEGLLWQNKEYLDPADYPDVWQQRSQSTVAPLHMNPEILDEVIKYVFLPKHVINAYRDYAEQIKKGQVQQP